MENREDLRSITGLLPLRLRSSSLLWPSDVVDALKVLSRGPHHSRVQSGEVLFHAISDLRNSLGISAEQLAPYASEGYAHFFDELMSVDESTNWFGVVIPALADLLLRFPSLLEAHYQHADGLRHRALDGVKTGLRLLESQEAGIVLLGQELIGALLTCSFFCLFPITSRGAKHLPTINSDKLFASLYDNYTEKQENKIKCIIHYFERICLCMPVGFVSFERKVLPLEDGPVGVVYPYASFWSNSVVSLCSFQVNRSGLIEDQLSDALEIDFANKYIGGGALHKGCVQEEIRFMINPELIAGMLFLPAMADNEAIEIVGVERFSNYTGYGSSFRFSGDHVDKKEVDVLGRRKTRIVAIDALCSPGMRQYGLECLLREINKAFCGFHDQSKHKQYQRLFRDNRVCDVQNDQYIKTVGSSICTGINEDCLGIATGNWGCGVFGGDPQLKSIIQWLAASQALRPCISYYTFDVEPLQTLEQVTGWVWSQKWTVGDLWNMLLEYASQRMNRETELAFFDWLVPSLSFDDMPTI